MAESDFPAEEIEPTVVLGASGDDEEETATPPETPLTDAAFRERYEFICKFAEGGIGELGKARDRIFNRIVAVKRLKPDFQDRPAAVAAFLDECRLNAQLDHPSIVPVYGLGLGRDGHWQLAMKLINGTSLYDYITEARRAYDRHQTPPAREPHQLALRLEYFLKICEVIAYCHSQKIVHGDIKPENVLLGRFGELYMMDWGCARPFGSTPRRLSGTPAYLPPEYLKDRVATPLVDVYSLGVLLFEITTLLRSREHNLTEGAGDGATSCRVDDRRRYHHYLPSIRLNSRIKAIIFKAVNPDPAQRYPSVKALADDVRRFVYDEEISAAPDNPSQKLFRLINRHRLRALLITMAIFCALAGSSFYSYYRANRIEQQRNGDLLRQLRLQAYTDTLAVAIEKRFLLCQAQLLLFADNLQELMSNPPPVTTRFYDNSAYREEATSPPGMLRAPFYPNPINLHYMVRMLPQQANGVEIPALDPKIYVELCNKVLGYHLDSHYINDVKTIHRQLLNADNLLQRLFVIWANDVRYGYPGTYEDPAAAAFQHCYYSTPELEQRKQILWSRPYLGVIERYRINCRYPMYDRQNRYLGIAGLELRLGTLLEPLCQANAADPIHELFLIGSDRSVIAILDGRPQLMAETTRSLTGLDVETVLTLSDELQHRNYQQFAREFQGKTYHLAGRPLATIGGILLQAIEDEALNNHEHKEVF